MDEGFAGPTLTSKAGPQAYKFLRYFSMRFSTVPTLVAEGFAEAGEGGFTLRDEAV
jgi:hypothetical protein